MTAEGRALIRRSTGLLDSSVVLVLFTCCCFFFYFDIIRSVNIVTLTWCCCRPAITPPPRDPLPVVPSISQRSVPRVKTPIQPRLKTPPQPPRVQLSNNFLDSDSKKVPPASSVRPKSGSSIDDLVCLLPFHFC
jgi:hypothetical protein